MEFPSEMNLEGKASMASGAVRCGARALTIIVGMFTAVYMFYMFRVKVRFTETKGTMTGPRGGRGSGRPARSGAPGAKEARERPGGGSSCSCGSAPDRPEVHLDHPARDEGAPAGGLRVPPALEGDLQRYRSQAA